MRGGAGGFKGKENLVNITIKPIAGNFIFLSFLDSRRRGAICRVEFYTNSILILYYILDLNRCFQHTIHEIFFLALEGAY